MTSPEKHFSQHPESESERTIESFSNQNFYERLGISRDASDEKITDTFRLLSKQYHPDTGHGNEEIYKRISEAYDTLKNHQKRVRYDGWLFEHSEEQIVPKEGSTDNEQERRETKDENVSEETINKKTETAEENGEENEEEEFHPKETIKENPENTVTQKQEKTSMERQIEEGRIRELREELGLANQEGKKTGPKDQEKNGNEQPKKTQPEKRIRMYETGGHTQEVRKFAEENLGKIYDELPKSSVKTKDVRNIVTATEMGQNMSRWYTIGEKYIGKLSRRIAWLYWHLLPKEIFIEKGISVIGPWIMAEASRKSMVKLATLKAEDKGEDVDKELDHLYTEMKIYYDRGQEPQENSEQGEDGEDNYKKAA